MIGLQSFSTIFYRPLLPFRPNTRDAFLVLCYLLNVFTTRSWYLDFFPCEFPSIINFDAASCCVTLSLSTHFVFKLNSSIRARREGRKAETAVLGPEPQRRPGARPSPPGLTFDLISILYRITCVSNNTIFAFKYLIPQTSIPTKTQIFL